MNIDLLLAKKPDYYKLSQSEQLKYLIYDYLSFNHLDSFRHEIIKNIYDEYDLVKPSNFSRELNKLLKGRIPVIIKKSDHFVFHPFYRKELEQEFSIDLTPTEEKRSKHQRRKENVMLINKYELHPKIKEVAYSQFQDGYYKEAIQNAFVEVINQVKIKAKNPTKEINGRAIELDGDDLMNRVFGCDGANVPVIKFNSLNNSLERAEQRGLMNLYKGIVGIRDLKAHLNFVQNDPHKTIEYLSLASLLMRLLDENVFSYS